jgi:hypothetical protein
MKIVSNDDMQQVRSFTGDKLDWMSGLSGDPRLDSRAFEVGFCIAQHVNRKTGVAILSDDTISDRTGIPRRWVLRARSRLRETGWISWRRTKTANVYWTTADSLDAVADHQVLLKDARADRRAAAKAGCLVAPPMAHLKSEDVPPAAVLDVPPVAIPDVPPVANVHLSVNTVNNTPSRFGLIEEEPLLRVTHPQLAEVRLLEALGEGDAQNGLVVADAIGDGRFRFLLREIQNGSLYPSTVRSAIDAACRCEVAA